MIGEAGLTTALHSAGYTMTERDPDFVILGETRTYSFERITTAIRLIDNGARFIATNPDPTGPCRDGALPATGAVAALIERATGKSPYYVGKPNPLMMRSALNAIDAHSESTAMVGDRMDTDVVAGLEAGLHTVLVLTGVTTVDEADRFPFRPSRIVDSIADLVDELPGLMLVAALAVAAALAPAYGGRTDEGRRIMIEVERGRVVLVHSELNSYDVQDVRRDRAAPRPRPRERADRQATGASR